MSFVWVHRATVQKRRLGGAILLFRFVFEGKVDSSSIFTHLVLLSHPCPTILSTIYTISMTVKLNVEMKVKAKNHTLKRNNNGCR